MGGTIEQISNNTWTIIPDPNLKKQIKELRERLDWTERHRYLLEKENYELKLKLESLVSTSSSKTKKMALFGDDDDVFAKKLADTKNSPCGMFGDDDDEHATKSVVAKTKTRIKKSSLFSND